jgi:hypothetical protein
VCEGEGKVEMAVKMTPWKMDNREVVVELTDGGTTESGEEENGAAATGSGSPRRDDCSFGLDLTGDGRRARWRLQWWLGALASQARRWRRELGDYARGCFDNGR